MIRGIACCMLGLFFGSLALAGVTKVPGGVEFTYFDPSAYSVSLAGTFNDWDTRANPMTRDEEGVWRIVLPLSSGRYEYKFVVNGSTWMADPDNPKVVGEYGNSEIEIDAEGNPVIRGFVQMISNTTANPRVMITGWLRGTYAARRNALGDLRWRLSRPSHEAYVAFNPTIGDDVKGSATIRIDSGEGDIRKITADLYSGWLKYKSQRFDITAYHNEEIVTFGDPFGLVGNQDLPGTLWKDGIDFGRGTQGLLVDLRVAGSGIRTIYANTFDANIYNSGFRWVYDPATQSYSSSDRYDNLGTDILGIRAERKLFGIKGGLTLNLVRNGWWVGFEDKPLSDALKRYQEDTGDLRSYWFEMGTSQLDWGIDLDWTIWNSLRILGGYLSQTYEAGWDAGNRVRKEGDNFVDGKIDVPVGDEDGKMFKVGIRGALKRIDLSLAYSRTKWTGMDSGEVYVTADQLPVEDAESKLIGLYGFSIVRMQRYLRSYGNVFNIPGFTIYELDPVPERDFGEFEISVKTTIAGINASILTEIAKRKWDYMPYADSSLTDFDQNHLRIIPVFSGKNFYEHLNWRLVLGITDEDLSNRMPSPFDTREVIFACKFKLSDKWSVDWDSRWIRYKWNSDEAEVEQSFYNTYMAVSWSPVKNVGLKLGYGLDPLYYRDTPVEGREIGRERWLASDLWSNPTATLVDAERRLERLEMISLMAVISF
ncbi:MAG: glycogen-binding domain-containing protein [bacterium]